jgi:hypothetical protein
VTANLSVESMEKLDRGLGALRVITIAAAGFFCNGRRPYLLGGRGIFIVIPDLVIVVLVFFVIVVVVAISGALFTNF